MVTGGMTPRAALSEVCGRLEQAGCEDAAYDAGFLYTLVTGKNAYLNETPLTPEQAQLLEKRCGERAAHTPLQYLAGEWGFMDFMLKVGPGVLCPRPDTEIVAEMAIEALHKSNSLAPQVLDLCAGTGALGIALRHFVPEAQVTCVEKSPEALAYLRENTAALRPFGISEAVRAVEGDLFTYAKRLPEGSLDMIVCNPPYLTTEEMGQLQPEAAREPAAALDGGPDGLVFYRALAEHYKEKLVPGGLIVLEIGWQQRESVTALLAANDWTEICCIQDFAGHDRCILAKRPPREENN